MITIRKGTKEDLPGAYHLIKELAIFEKAPEQVTNTLEMMEKDGFGEDPIFEFIVAEEDGALLGMALYYYRYSTWKGRRLFLEDLIVTESQRSRGIGKLLFDKTISTAREKDCTGMNWQVLDWNEPAIEFYKQYAAKMDGEWINCNLNF